MSDTAQFQGPLPYEVYRSQLALRAAEEAAAQKIDVTESGGRFLAADGTEIDANGKPLKRGGVNAAPAGTSAALGADAEIVYAEMLERARAEARAELDAQKADGSGFADMTVTELRDEAAKRNVDIPSGSNKADIVALLEAADAGNGGA